MVCMSEGLGWVVCWSCQVDMEAAERLLRGAVFAQWRASQCESYEDTLKLTSLIDVFLPFLPCSASTCRSC